MHQVKGLFAIALLLPAIGLAESNSCNTNAEKRTVIGKEPTAKVLYAKLANIELGSWKSGFSDETFTYIGIVHTKKRKTYKIGYLSTVWGESCRATNRLFIFDGNNKYLGQYDGIMLDPKRVWIAGAVLHFPFKSDDGNTLDLANGPPESAWLDGENPEWIPASNKPR